MYLHVGNNKSIRIKDIIGIFDTDNATQSTVTRKYLSQAEKNGNLMVTVEEIPKSFIVYKTSDGVAVCLSQISVKALEGRCHERGS